MGSRRLSRLQLPLVLLVFSLLRTTIGTADHDADDDAAKSYVVYLGGHPPRGSMQASDRYVKAATYAHHTLLASVLGSKEKAQDSIIYSYTRSINGFAARLTEDQAKEISRNPEVLSVFPNTRRKLHTTKSWDFLGLESGGNGMVGMDSLWKKARYGDGIIIANIDTGVWPESASFGDEGMGPVPSRWKGYCEKVVDPKDTVKCNRKLIGARHFSLGRPPTDQYSSARDFDGHGTHTLSIAVSAFIRGANIFEITNGTPRVGLPEPVSPLTRFALTGHAPTRTSSPSHKEEQRMGSAYDHARS